MTDLKLIDELLCHIKSELQLTWADVELYSSITYKSMQRLRTAWESGEMGIITLSLANYFRDGDPKSI